MSYGPLDLNDLQYEVGKWSTRNFGEQPSSNPLLGIMEELGELSHAHLKGLQGIRHTPEEIQEMKEDAIADIIIYICDYCYDEGIDLEAAIISTWSKVRQRNWADNPQGAADAEDSDQP